jgi:hypothetical protein
MTLNELRQTKNWAAIKFVHSEQILIDFIADTHDRPLCGIVSYEFGKYWFEMIESLEEIDEFIIQNPKYAILNIGEFIEVEIKNALNFISHQRAGTLTEYFKLSKSNEKSNYENFIVIGIFTIKKLNIL